MPKHALVAIVVTMNRLDHLQKTLDRLLASDAQTLGAVVVVNNQSTDGTGAWLTAHSDARVIHLPQGENRGGAGGFEAGLCHVRDHMAADWVLLMDDDGRPAAGCLEAFHSAPREGIDGWVSAVRYPSGAICEMNRPWINPFWSVSGFIRGLTKGRAGFHIPNTAFDGGVVEIDGGSFVGLFLSARAIDLGGCRTVICSCTATMFCTVWGCAETGAGWALIRRWGSSMIAKHLTPMTAPSHRCGRPITCTATS